MPLQFNCPQCQQPTTVGDEFAGQVYTCSCGFMLRLAAPEPPAAPVGSPYTSPNFSEPQLSGGAVANPDGEIPTQSSAKKRGFFTPGRIVIYTLLGAFLIAAILEFSAKGNAQAVYDTLDSSVGDEAELQGQLVDRRDGLRSYIKDLRGLEPLEGDFENKDIFSFGGILRSYYIIVQYTYTGHVRNIELASPMFNEDPEFLKPNSTSDNSGMIGPNSIGEDDRRKMQQMAEDMGGDSPSTDE